MLVISRRENEKFLFPNLGITIQLIKVKGKVARIGIEAPPHVRILREEVLDDQQDEHFQTDAGAGRESCEPLSEPGPTAVSESSAQYRNSNLECERKHRLKAIELSLQVAKQRIEAGQIDGLNGMLERILVDLRKLDGDTGHAAFTDSNFKNELRTHDALIRGDRNTKLALVVEDNANEQSLLGAILEHRGFDVVMVEDGHTALKYLRNTLRMPDVVLLDVDTSLEEGNQTVSEIRSDSSLRGLTVIAVCDNDLDETKSAILRQGFDRRITKPVDCKRLVEDIQELHSAP